MTLFRIKPNLLLPISFLLIGLCQAEPAAWAAKTIRPSSYQLHPGDRLKIQIYRENDLSGEYSIGPSGTFDFPLVGEIHAAGLEMDELQALLTERLKKYLVNPQATITRTESAIKSISVLGHVKNPGTFDFAPGSTLMRLISQAGGFAPSAKKSKVRIVRVVNGDKHVILVDAQRVISGEDDDTELQAGDMIFVPESIF